MPSPQPLPDPPPTAAAPRAADHAIGHVIGPNDVTDHMVGAGRARRWRRWMPWWAGTYFVAAYAVASLTSEAADPTDAIGVLFGLVDIPLGLVAAWYCFRRARHSLIHGLVALGLGVAVFASALDMGSNALGAVLMTFPVVAGWYGATRILDRHRGIVPGWSEHPRRTLQLVGLGLLVGVVLGAVNLIEPILDGHTLALGSPPETVRALLGALQPGIAEEVTFHFFPLAWWIAARGGLPVSRRGTLGMYAWLILPHAALHVPDLVLTDPGAALVQTLYPAIVFGVPLVWLTVRRGAAAAIAAHWGIDAIRFALGW